MAKVYIKRLEDLSKIEAQCFYASKLFQQSETTYLHSAAEDSFSKEYFRASEPTPMNIVGFLDETPCLFFRGQIQANRLSYWGRPIKPYQSVEISGESLRVLYTALLKEFEIAGIQTATFFHHDFLLATLWSQRVETRSELRGWIDLTRSESDILASFRKSYRSLINWGRRSMKVELFDCHNMTSETIELFRKFHIRVAKRETRSLESWQCQEKIVRDGRGYIVLGYFENTLASAILVLHGSESAFYGVAVNDREQMANGHAIGHWPLVHSILHAKSLGLSKFDIGMLSSPHFDDKEIAIANFKKGFCDQISVETIHDFRLKATDAV